jgi:hypothetical protein
MPMNADPATLRFVVISLTIALEETLKALADSNGGKAGAWLDEVQDLALLRGKAALIERSNPDDVAATAAALHISEAIFARMRSSL